MFGALSTYRYPHFVHEHDLLGEEHVLRVMERRAAPTPRPEGQAVHQLLPVDSNDPAVPGRALLRAQVSSSLWFARLPRDI